MKRRFNISIFLFSVLLSATTQCFAQDLPMACTGSVERYGVGHKLPDSFFTWKITAEDGTNIPYTALNVNADTIQVNWDESFTGGICTFEVIEHPTFTGCGEGEPFRDSLMLNSPVIFLPFEGVPSSFAVCYGDTAHLDPGLFQNYLWQDESTNRIYATTEAGTYEVRLIDQNQNCSYNQIEAKINPLPMVWLGNDTVLFGNQTIDLDVTNPNFVFYNWSTGSIFSSITVDGLSGNQNIWVKVTDENNCKNSDTILISAADYDNLRIPAAFTPNGDGINDKWYFPAPPKGSDLVQDLYPYFDGIEVRIFNRYGKLVWESNQDFVAWDGKDLKGEALPMDSYHYLIKLKANGKTYVYKGSITIVR